MKRVFIDTNVFIDFLAKRPNFYEAAAKIVSLAYHKKIKLYVSALSFATGSYLLEHHYKMSPKEISDSYEVFISFCRVTTVDYEVVNSSLNSTFSDFNGC